MKALKALVSSFSSVTAPIMNGPCKISSKEQVSTLLDSIDFVLTDCDGVLYRSTGAIAGAADALSSMRAKGKKIIFVTNNSTISRVKAAAKLNDMGFAAAVDDVFTSSFAVADYLKRQQFIGKVFVVGCQGIQEELDNVSIPNVGVGSEIVTDVLIPEVDLDPAVNAVVISFDNKISLAKLIKACTYASKVDPMFFVGAEPDESVLRMNGQMLPLAGATVSFVETAINRKAVIVGKPMSHLFQSIREAHPGLDPRRTLMIGDRMGTDIAFGNRNAVQFTLLVESGVDQFEDAVRAAQTPGRGTQVPTHSIESLGHLNQYFS